MSIFESQLAQGIEVPIDQKNILETDQRKSRGDVTALYLLTEPAFEQVYGPKERALIASRVQDLDHLITPEEYTRTSTIWPEVEMIFSGWGMVPLDEAFFRRFPQLKVIFYAAGSVRSFVTDAFWRRNIRLTNAAAANAVPVGEFTISQIIFALKHGAQQAAYIRKYRKFPSPYHPPGAYQTTVGIISLGMIGSLVAERLQQFDLNVIAYDPYFPAEAARKLNVKLVSLEELFKFSDVVSCHTPVLQETEKMIRRAHFESMKPNATFINTARGEIVHEEEMILALQSRPDLFAMLDVTQPFPPIEGSPLYTMDNIMLTPHIAGSLGAECRRMGKLMVEELDRFLTGKPLRYEIDQEQFQTMA